MAAAERNRKGAIGRHNSRIGRPFALFVQRFLLIFLIGPPAYLLIRLFLRIRIEGRKRLGHMNSGGIFVLRHFFEWDPLLAYWATTWWRSLVRPQLHSQFLASGFWVRSAVARALAWIFGVLLVGRAGIGHSALKRAATLLTGRRPVTIGICPTGPVGRRRTYEIRPGIGHLALRCPQATILPVNVIGLQEIRLRDVLTMSRPRVTFVFCEAFTGADIWGTTDEERVRGVCERVDREWRHAEALAREDVEIRR